MEGSRYSVPTNVLGQKVEIRRPVDSNRFEVRWAGKIIATHALVAGTHVDVWDPALRLITDTIDEAEQGRLELGDGFDVEPPDLAARYPLDIDGSDGEVGT